MQNWVDYADKSRLSRQTSLLYISHDLLTLSVTWIYSLIIRVDNFSVPLLDVRANFIDYQFKNSGSYDIAVYYELLWGSKFTLIFLKREIVSDTHN